MPSAEPIPIEKPPRLEDMTEEQKKDHLDYCAAAEALDEFLHDREPSP